MLASEETGECVHPERILELVEVDVGQRIAGCDASVGEVDVQSAMFFDGSVADLDDDFFVCCIGLLSDDLCFFNSSAQVESRSTRRTLVFGKRSCRSFSRSGSPSPL